MKLVLRSSIIFAGLFIAIGNIASAASAVLDYPVPLASGQPYDVNLDALKGLDRDAQIPEAQRLFDIFAWQTFVALNWPALPDGRPDPQKNLSDNTAPRVWASYHEASAVYREDGKSPKTADQPGAWKQVSKKSWGDLIAAGYKPGERVLWMSSKLHNRNARKPYVKANESLQAFTGPLIDQAGKWVRYEVLMNDTEFDYIVQNELYNQEGQAKFTAMNQVSFPANDGTKKRGSMEVKLAWKQLDPARDDPSRFFAVEAWVVPYDPAAQDKAGKPFKAKMGLVGMHVSVLTQSSPVWIWSTFEHVDCVQVNDLTFGTNGKGEKIRIRPLFTNPELPTKLPNVLPPYTYTAPGGTTPTDWSEPLNTSPVQVLRVTPIADATEALNDQVRALLAKEKSVFQYYRLVGTQWPVQPKFPAFANGNGAAPESIVYKIPGKVVPVFLVNVTMETYFQAGVQPAGPMAADDRLPKVPTPIPANLQPYVSSGGQLVADPTLVFGTESCAGCHFSAGAVVGFKRNADGLLLWTDPDGTQTTTPKPGAVKVPIYGENGVFGQNGNAHFSWLLQLKAKSVEPYDGK